MDPLLSQAPQQRLAITGALRQALEVLQMPHLELAQWLRSEIDKNPLLEEIRPLFPLSFAHSSEQLPSPHSLYDHLQQQIGEAFSCPKKRAIAEQLLHHLDERGFLSAFPEITPEVEEVLAILQTFDPPGIFARNLRETLLLQLRALGEMQTPSYLLVRDCFEDLLKGRYGAIEKKWGRSDLSAAVQKLARLSFRPARLFRDEIAPTAIPDLRILKTARQWIIEVAEEELPKIHIQTEYSTLSLDSEEEQEAIRRWSVSAKWLFRSLGRRRRALLEIGSFLVKKQARFLEQKGDLSRLTLQEAAHVLQLHESTLSRALAGKYAVTPRGLIALRSLFTASPSTEKAKEALRRIILEEDPRHPLTDQQLSKELQKKGFFVARRTVAKYREELQIGSATVRKHLIRNTSSE